MLLSLAAPLAAGCGGGSGTSGPETTVEPDRAGAPEGTPPGAVAQECETEAVDAADLTASAIGCGEAREVMFGWQRNDACSAAGSSHSSCTIRGYRCFATRTQRGLSVGCSRPGRSLAFRIPRS